MCAAAFFGKERPLNMYADGTRASLCGAETAGKDLDRVTQDARRRTRDGRNERRDAGRREHRRKLSHPLGFGGEIDAEPPAPSRSSSRHAEDGEESLGACHLLMFLRLSC